MSGAAGRPGGNLPIPVTRFVGRRSELVQLRRQLQECRLLTLTGVGGVGKTRLAVEAAHAVRRAFPGGVWLVDLAAVPDSGQVAQAVVSVLGVVDRSTRRPLDKVVDFFGERPTLLVLDNCEHVADGCAELVADLLGRASGVKVLATSRRILGIAGEHLYAVPPLAVPELDVGTPPEALARYDAVQLLADRARALRPAFELTGANLAAAVRLCARLDGLPLAIELAATRLRSLSLDQLVERLSDRLPLLAGIGAEGTRLHAGDPRQATLRAVMEWSHSLCSPRDRLLWARLSVFAGGFDLAAAEGVCADDGLPLGDVLGVLDRLVAQSIVLADAHGPAVRFRLLETIRQYGRERLVELGEEAALLRRHRDYFLALAQAVADGWCTPAQESGLARLRTERGNLGAALEQALADPAGPARALLLVAALRHHWFADAFLGEGRGWLDQALALPVPPDPPEPGGPSPVPAAVARVDALWVAAWVCLLQGDEALAAARLAECEALAARLGDDRATGFVRSLRGTALLFGGELDAAVAAYQDGMAIFDRIGVTEGSLWGMFQLAIALAHKGGSARARAICQQAIALSEASGDRLCRSYTLWVLGFDTWRCGDLERAAGWAREGLTIQRAFNDPVGVALIIELLSWVAESQDDLTGAARLLGTADSVWAQIGTTLAAFGPPLQVHRTACEERVGAGLGAQRAATERARGRHPTVEAAIASILDPVAPARPRPSGTLLTSREDEVAVLLASGMSNREIAGQLVISQRTVDGHVERILAKLGFTARTQVAAWIARREVAGERAPEGVSSPSPK